MHYILDLIYIKNKVQKLNYIPWKPWKSFLSYRTFFFQNLFLLQRIFIRHYNRRIILAASCFKSRKRSIRCLEKSWTRPYFMSRRNILDSTAELHVARFILHLPAHILPGRKKCIFLTDTTLIKASQIRWLVY